VSDPRHCTTALVIEWLGEQFGKERELVDVHQKSLKDHAAIVYQIHGELKRMKKMYMHAKNALEDIGSDYSGQSAGDDAYESLCELEKLVME